MKTLLLKWWLFFCAQSVVALTAYEFGFFTELVEKDPTRLSFVILTILCPILPPLITVGDKIEVIRITQSR